MGDSWEYRVLWEYAGLTPPNLHEDELQEVINVLDGVTDGVGSGLDKVSHEIRLLKESGTSSLAVDSVCDRWVNGGQKALLSLDNTLGELRGKLGQILVDIYEWKARLAVVVGLADMGLTLEYVASGGIGFLADKIGMRVGVAEVRGKLEGLLDEFEQKLVSTVIDGTPLHQMQHRVAQELQRILDQSIDHAGSAVGSNARGDL